MTTGTDNITDTVIAAIVAETGLSPNGISSETTFRDIGVESVLSIGVVDRLEATFGPLSKALLFEFSTVGKLVAHLSMNETTIDEKPATQSQDPVDSTPSSTSAPTPASVVASVNPSESTRVTPPVFTASPEPAHSTPLAPPAPVASPPEAQDDDPIAIIGMAGQFPQARNIATFWDNLVGGEDNIEVIPDRLWDWEEFWDERAGIAGRSYAKWGGFIPDHRNFDPLFFRMSKLEAQSIDPQERVFLETVYHALEHAQYPRSKRQMSRVGLFVAIMWGSYQHYGSMSANAGASFATIANRASFALDLTGPSIPIDTMCSGSLTTLHMGAQSIRNGECDMAVVGGVNLTTHPNKYFVLSRTGFAARDGRCKPFADAADGYVPSEGSGALVLKRLSAAEHDGDRVLAVLRHSAVNHGGLVNNLTMPNVEAQEALINTTFAEGKVMPDSIGYIEAHAPGTSLGDPIEVRSLSEVFTRHGVERKDIPIGSVKSNVGHLESAAGVASIVKVVEQMRHRRLVPTIHAETVNPNIDFDASPFTLQTGLTPWVPQSDEAGTELPYRALINCFGAGGTNAHALLEAGAMRRVLPKPKLEGRELFLFSARTRRALTALLQQHKHALDLFVTRSETQQAIDLEKAVVDAVGLVADVNVRHVSLTDPMADLLPTAARIAALPEAVAKTTGVLLTPGEMASLQTVNDVIEQVRFFAIPDYLPQSVESELAYFQSLAYATQTGRDPMEYRTAIVADDIHELRSSLEALSAGMGNGLDRCFGGSATPSDVIALQAELSEDYIGQLLSNARLNKLAELWVQGLNVDWASSFPTASMHVDLPLYPFDHEICWAPDSRPDQSWQDGSPEPSGVGVDLDKSIETGHLHMQAILDPKRGESLQVQTVARMIAAAEPDAAKAITVKIEQWRDLRVMDAQGCVPDVFVLDGSSANTRVVQALFEGQMLAEIRLSPAPDPSYLTSSISGSLGNITIPMAPALSDPSAATGTARVSRFELGATANFETLLGLALKCCATIGEDTGTEPMLLGHVMRYTDIPRNGYIVVSRLSGEDLQVQILDDQGGPFLACTRVSLVHAGTQELPDPKVRRFDSRWTTVGHVDQPEKGSLGNVLIFASSTEDVQHLAGTSRYAKKQLQWVVLGQNRISRLRQDGGWEIGMEDLSALRACLQLVDDPDAIVFVSSGRPEAAKAELLVLHLIAQQALRRNLFRRNNLDFIVVTRGAFGLPGDTPIPSGLGGYVQTLARETSHQVTHVDIGTVDDVLIDSSIAEVVVSVSRHQQNGRPLALRDGTLWTETLEETALTPNAAPQFRRAGHYVMFGGSGTVGQQLSLELARRHQARLTWVSRGALSDAAQVTIDEIRAMGGDVMHIRADIVDTAAVQQACDSAREFFGPIHGLLHMTMTRNIRRIADLEVDTFAALCDGKLSGTDNLLAASAHEQPDFTLLFSSIDVHIGSVGWSAYTAGCAYQTAAAAGARASGAPVFAIGWGFWAGIDEVIAGSLSEKGIGLINAAQGVDAIEAVLSGRHSGSVVAIADDDMLQNAGFDIISKSPDHLPEVPSEIPAPSRVSEDAVAVSTISQNDAPSQEVTQPIAHEWPTGDILGNLTDLFAEILKTEVSTLEPDTDLLNYGVDSLIVVNIQAAMEDRLGPVPTALLLENATLRQISEALERDHPAAADALRNQSKPTSASAVAPITNDEAVEAVKTPEALASPIQKSPVRVLRQVPAAGIEAFLRAYPSLYDEKALDVGLAPALPGSDDVNAMTHGMVKLETGEVEFFAVGLGAAVVMISAVALTAPIWTHVMTSDLATKYRLIVVHQPGYGLSDAVTDCGNRETAQIILNALETMGEAGPYHILASCLGSVPGMHFAADFPDDTASLTLVGAFHDASDLEGGDPSTMSSKEFAQLAETAVATLHSDFDMVGKIEAARDGDTTAMEAQVEDSRNLLLSSQKVNFLVALRYLNEMMAGSMMPVLERITTRCLCIYGDADQIIAPRHSLDIAGVVEQAKLSKINGAGHFPYLTHPTIFLPRFANFLDGLSAAQSDSADLRELEMKNE